MDLAIGYLDKVTADHVIGWAWNPGRPEETVEVDLYCDGDVVLRVAADRYRQDLLAAGKGTGRYGFSIAGLRSILPGGRHLIGARIADGGPDLRGSPCLVEID